MNNNSLQLRRNAVGRPLVLDGAIGSLIESEEKEKLPENLWSSAASLTKPEHVANLHENYLISGADIITTNTFRLKVGDSCLPDDIPVKIIKNEFSGLSKLRHRYNFLIAGSNGPVEDSYTSIRTLSTGQIERLHARTIDTLAAAGADFILNETLSHLDEILFTSRYCFENDIEYVTSIYFDASLNILSGESVWDVVKKVQKFHPAAISFNCVKPELFEHLLRVMRELNFPHGFYLNCGIGKQTDNSPECGISPIDYVTGIVKYITPYTLFVGSCCGSNAAHTKLLKEYLSELH